MHVWRQSAGRPGQHAAGAWNNVCRLNSWCGICWWYIDCLLVVWQSQWFPSGRSCFAAGKPCQAESSQQHWYSQPSFRPAILTTTTTTTPIMSLSSQSARPLACLKQALRQCRAERQQQQTRSYAAAASQVQYPSLQTRYPPPSKGFRTSQTTKQNREYIENLPNPCNH